jgi:peptidyl-prolyl cis-trans isomerase SurA
VDTTGLQQFYEKNKEKYMWQPAIKGVVYKSVDETYAKKLVKELNNPNNKTPDEVSKAVNGDGSQGFVTFESGKYEKSRFPAGTKLVAGKYAPYFKNKDESYTLVDVKEVFDTPTQKTLSEAKGYVVSEYQEYLEKQWLAELENKYPVVVNQETLKAMIR